MANKKKPGGKKRKKENGQKSRTKRNGTNGTLDFTKIN